MTPARSARRTLDRSDRFVVLATVGGVALLIWLGLGLTFFADEWGVIAERSITLDDLLRPFNEHWLAVTILVYRSMFAIVGLHSYVPYLALLAVLHGIVALLVYALVRRRTLRPIAVGITLVVLVFGSGFENLFWGIQIDFVGPTALGFAALLLLDDLPTLPGRGRAAGAAALLTIGVMTSRYGLFLLALVGFDLLVDARRRKWILALFVPALVYGTWYLVFGRSGVATHGDPFTIDRLLAVPRFILDGMGAAFGAATGWGVLIGPLLPLGLLAWIGYLAAKRRPIPSRAIACLLAIAAQYAIVGLVRSQLGVDATVYTRYTYLSGMVALICLASLIGTPEIPRERMRLVIGLGAILLTASLTWNLSLLIAGRNLYAERAERTRALITVGLSDPLPEGVDPTLSLILVPAPTDLRGLIDEHGSPLTDALVPGFVPPVSQAAMDDAVTRALNPPGWLLGTEPAP